MQPARGAPLRGLLLHAGVAAVVYGIDAFVLAQGAVAGITTVVLTLFGLGHVVRGLASRGKGIVYGASMIAIYVGMIFAVVGTISANNQLASRRAAEIVVALTRYKATTGDYPVRLTDVVPGYLPSVPRAKYKCFSQWYPAPFVVNGITCPTAEHSMMAEKARLFGDEETARAALAAPHPAAAKAEGRKVRGFVEAVWEERRFGIVVAANHAKFSQHAALRDVLLATSTRVLVEASPTDRIWGIGLAAADPQAQSPLHWRGLNLLGFALMAARAQIAAAKQAL